MLKNDIFSHSHTHKDGGGALHDFIPAYRRVYPPQHSHGRAARQVHRGLTSHQGEINVTHTTHA